MCSVAYDCVRAPSSHLQSLSTPRHPGSTATETTITSSPTYLPLDPTPARLSLCDLLVHTSPPLTLTLTMSSTTILTFVALFISTLLTFAPLSTAQSTLYLDRWIHGWSPYNFAPSPDPRTAHLVYVLDGQRDVVLVDSRDGRIVRSANFTNRDGHYLFEIAVDSHGFVLVTATTARVQGQQLLVLNSDLQQVATVDFSSSLKPPPGPSVRVQLAVDSTDTVYLFDGHTRSSNPGTVWVLNPSQWTQQQTWEAPISLVNFTGCVMVIDNEDMLYFQSVAGYKMLYVTDVSGMVQMTYQLGTGNMSEPRISRMAIDAHLQMWHTYQDNGFITVRDSNGKLVAVYDILQDHVAIQNRIAADANNNIIASDSFEQALLFLSQSGDILKTVASPVAPMLQVVLLGDYVGNGRGAGSLLFYDFGISLDEVQRISVDDDNIGTLLQCYPLPPRIDDHCSILTLDVGVRTGNMYMLLWCWNQQQRYILMHVMNRAGRLVAEWLVDADARHVRVDEAASTLYVSVDKYPAAGSVMVYSMATGELSVNLTTSNPEIDLITEMTLIPGMQGSHSLLICNDQYNDRFLLFRVNNITKPVIAPFPNNTFFEQLTFSLGPQPSFYATGYTDIDATYPNFIHKFDLSDLNNPKLTDIYVTPLGVSVQLQSVVVGLDGHLYAAAAGHLYQWRLADRPPPPPAAPATSEQANEQQQQSVEDAPHVHIGAAVVGSADAQNAEVSKLIAMPRLAAHDRHGRMRGANSA